MSMRLSRLPGQGLLPGLLWLLLAAFAGLMGSIVLPYLLPPFPTDLDFLLTKRGALRVPLWRWAFYVHIGSSLLVMLAALPQWSRWVLRERRALHRFCGRAYVALILLVAAPSGLLMALYANGGPIAQAGFVAQALLWAGTTYLAYRSIRRGQVAAHLRWMVYSMALTLSAVSLRFASFLQGLLGMGLDYKSLYTVLSWGSWGFNLLLAAALLHGGLGAYFAKNIGKKRPA